MQASEEGQVSASEDKASEDKASEDKASEEKVRRLSSMSVGQGEPVGHQAISPLCENLFLPSTNPTKEGNRAIMTCRL